MINELEKETPYTYRKVVDEQFTPYGRGYLPPLSVIFFNGDEINAVRYDIDVVELIVKLANEAFNKGRETQISRSRNFKVINKDDTFVFGNDQFNS